MEDTIRNNVQITSTDKAYISCHLVIIQLNNCIWSHKAGFRTIIMVAKDNSEHSNHEDLIERK